MVLESKFALYPNGRSCPDAKARNSAGRLDVSTVEESGRLEPVVGVAGSAVAAAVVVVEGLRAQDEKDEERNKVMRFVERRRKRNKIFEEYGGLDLSGESEAIGVSVFICLFRSLREEAKRWSGNKEIGVRQHTDTVWDIYNYSI